MKTSQNNPWSAPKNLGVKSQNLGNAHVRGELTDRKIDYYAEKGYYGQELASRIKEAKKLKASLKVKKAPRKTLRAMIDDLLA